MTTLSPRLLVVEDEQHLAVGLKLNFELEGYAVDMACTARKAGECLLQRPGYDAIILDVMLPDMTGFDLCRKLRDSGNFTPVLMLTALDSTQDRVTGLEVGADDYLAKPFELTELLARVRSLLRRRSWEQQKAPCAAAPAGDLVRRRGGRLRAARGAHERARGQADPPRVRPRALLRRPRRPGAQPPGAAGAGVEAGELPEHADGRQLHHALRRHFERDPSAPAHFVSVRGSGYKFVPDPPVAHDEPA
jgi:DNA-binding response OmpR family regulator